MPDCFGNQRFVPPTFRFPKMPAEGIQLLGGFRVHRQADIPPPLLFFASLHALILSLLFMFTPPPFNFSLHPTPMGFFK